MGASLTTSLKKWCGSLPRCHRSLLSFALISEMALDGHETTSYLVNSVPRRPHVFFLPESCDQEVETPYPQFPSVGAAMFYLTAPRPSGCPSQGRPTLAFLTDVSRK